MNEQVIAVVTGASSGLGLETSRQLATQGIKVIITGRDTAKGNAVTNDLLQQGLDVIFHYLDVTDDDSIKKIASFLKNEFGYISILVNNAGVFLDSMDANAQGNPGAFKTELDTLRQTMETNVYGPVSLIQELVPLMKANGRIVNVSSGMGQLSDMNSGCPGYRLSKTALNAVTRIYADELKDTQIKINSVCPGWVRTNMGGPNAERSVKEGAETIVWLATLSDAGHSGGFFRDKQPIPW